MIIRVIVVVVDTRQLRMYKEDGTTVDIPQGDHRLAEMLEKCKALSNPKAFKLFTNTAGVPYVEVDLKEEEKVRDTAYADYENQQKKTGGLTRFFRVMKNKLTELINGPNEIVPITPQRHGSVPIPVKDIKPETQVVPEKIDKAIDDIMAHAQPVTHEKFDANDTTDKETIVAITDDGKGNKSIVPGVENLKSHMVHATKTGNTVGMEAFLSRLGKFIKQRDHSVEDVLRFMEKGDLPLADDGCIIAYKVLRSTSKVDNSELGQGIFVDCHTGKVQQRVGSYVTQSENLIRQDKQQCGTGLHIARRAYLSGFSGDIIVMVKVKPEDVIVVPNGEPDKMRVKGYHILAKIPKDEHSKLRSNTAMTGTNALKLLTQAIAGEHIGVIEIVEITSASGGSFTVTPTNEKQNYQPTIKKDIVPTQPVAPAPVIEPPKLDAEKVDPKKVANEVEEKKTIKPKTKAEEARELYTAGKMAELKALKKASKQGWYKLGFSPAEEALIVGSGDSPMTNGQDQGANPQMLAESLAGSNPVLAAEVADIVKEIPNKKTKAAIKEVRDGKAKKTGTVAQTMKELNKPEPKKKKEEPVPAIVSLSGTRAEVARTLFNQAIAGDKSRWGSLWRHQKDCKKSWSILGFTDKEIERIKVNKPDHI